MAGVDSYWERCQWLVAAAILIGITGCAPKPPTQLPTQVTEDDDQHLPLATNQSATSPSSPNEILQRLLTAYRGAKSYQDAAVFKLQFKRGGEAEAYQWPASVVFERPNRLALDVFQAKVRVDGKELKASITDPESNNIDGQFVVRMAPAELKLADLAADQLLYDILSGRPRRQPIQLELLLESRGLASAFAADVACQLLEDGIAGGKPCRRIAVPSPGGDFIFWIDRDQSLLRRLDYPAAALLTDLSGDPSVTDLQFWVEMPEAKLNEKIAGDRFALEIPANAKIVKSFVPPPQPLPTRLFGKQPKEFHFTTLEGQRLTQAQLTKKIVVLAWYHDHPACEATLQQISLAAREFKDNPQVEFYAVSSDPSAVTAEQLRQKLADWQVELPILRDLEAFGDQSFQIEFQPTLTVLDEQGRVQIFQPGGNPELAKQLAVIIDRLLKGDDLALELTTQATREQEQYAALVAKGGNEPEPVVELAEPVIRRKSDPKSLNLTPQWTNSELKSPGNMLIVPGKSEEEPPRLIVCTGWRGVAEVDLAGKVLRQHELELPDQAAVTFLRTVVDKEGKRYFVGAAPLAPQWFLFDEEFKVLQAYPATTDSPLSITDLQFADLDDDGTAEVLAANVGLLGVHATTLTGETKWRNRTYPNVISLLVTPPNDVGSWQILLTGEAGNVLPLNRFGREEPERKVANWPLARLAVASFPTPTQAAFVGISNDAKGNLVAVGLTTPLRECWNYQLPAGAHQQPIDPIASSNVLEGHQGEWWFACADGSLHLVTEDGKLHDSLATGSILHGVAVLKHAGGGLLIVSTRDGLSASLVRKR
jgi:cytochrome oxidase Cu insertion factor (SCO1/SenC/PrrC family)